MTDRNFTGRLDMNRYIKEIFDVSTGVAGKLCNGFIGSASNFSNPAIVESDIRCAKKHYDFVGVNTDWDRSNVLDFLANSTEYWLSYSTFKTKSMESTYPIHSKGKISMAMALTDRFNIDAQMKLSPLNGIRVPDGLCIDDLLMLSVVDESDLQGYLSNSKAQNRFKRHSHINESIGLDLDHVLPFDFYFIGSEYHQK